MTYFPAERVTYPHVTQCNIEGWQIKTLVSGLGFSFYTMNRQVM